MVDRTPLFILLVTQQKEQYSTDQHFIMPCIVAQRLSIEVLVYTRRVKIRFPLRTKKHFHFLALVTRLSAVLSSTTQHALSRKLGETWGMECTNTKLPLPTLRCAGYSIKLENKLQ